jgi:hypothetical protein
VTSAVPDAETAAGQVVAALLPLADAQRAGQARRYLKSDLDFLGVSVPAIRSAVTDVARSDRELDRDGALAWARALWREPRARAPDRGHRGPALVHRAPAARPTWPW